MTKTLAEPPRFATDCRPSDRFGGKAANLLELQSAGFRVPPFVVSPPQIDEAISKLGTPFAVRSSATVEDGGTVSFAGQFRSFLNLQSVEDAEQAIGLCHVSVQQPSVLHYCQKHGVDPKSVRMEVIVQRMVDPELAGVAFTVNPVTGAEQVVIEACPGLADDLLTGRELALPDDHPLIEKYRSRIAAIARRIQLHFGAPQDIEFAIEAEKIYVLQSRPITRIGFTAETGQWTNADFRDGGVSSSVCTPLMSSLYQWIWDQSLKDTLRQLHLYRGDFQASKVCFGRPYWNLGAVKQCLASLPGFVERQFDEDLSVQINYQGNGLTTPSTPLRLLRAIPTVLAVNKFFASQQRLAEEILESKSASLSQQYGMVAENAEESFRRLIETDYLQVESTYFRTIFAASLAKLDFVSSFPEADYGSLVSALPPLSHVEPVRLVQAMPNRSDDQLSRVIDSYRHHYRVGLDLIHPRWDEDRSFVTQMLADLPASAGKDPRPVFESARAGMLLRLPRRKHGSFHRKLGRLRHFLWLREQLRDVSNQVYHLIRRHVLKIAERRGMGDAIFFQTYQEIFCDKRDNIDRNREIYESYRNFRSPNEIGSGFHFNPHRQSGELRGIAASPGTLAATAFVARDVAQATQMPRGKILVCPYTDPGWTAVLDRAGGVVTETGGLLSHAAIICREYGIPAVLGVEQATSRIADGADIVMHGGDGRVVLGKNGY